MRDAVADRDHNRQIRRRRVLGKSAANRIRQRFVAHAAVGRDGSTRRRLRRRTAQDLGLTMRVDL